MGARSMLCDRPALIKILVMVHIRVHVPRDNGRRCSESVRVIHKLTNISTDPWLLCCWNYCWSYWFAMATLFEGELGAETLIFGGVYMDVRYSHDWGECSAGAALDLSRGLVRRVNRLNCRPRCANKKANRCCLVPGLTRKRLPPLNCSPCCLTANAFTTRKAAPQCNHLHHGC